MITLITTNLNLALRSSQLETEVAAQVVGGDNVMHASLIANGLIPLMASVIVPIMTLLPSALSWVMMQLA
jgi:hypothetical protein